MWRNTLSIMVKNHLSRNQHKTEQVETLHVYKHANMIQK